MKTRQRRKTRRRKTRRRGGKKLGTGDRGFVVSPAIPCKDKNTSGRVSKVFIKPEDFEKAKTRLPPVLEVLQRIDPDQKHFLYPEFCKEFGDLTDENKADGITEETKQYSYLMKEGGAKTLLDIAKDVDMEMLKEYLDEIKEKIDLLHEHKILHGDIGPQNVLQMPDGTFRIIDFDSARVVTDKELEPVQYSFGPQPSKTQEQMRDEFLELAEIVYEMRELD